MDLCGLQSLLNQDHKCAITTAIIGNKIDWPRECVSCKLFKYVGGTALHSGCIRTSHLVVPVSILGIPKFKKIDGAEIYLHRHCIERVDSAKSLIVDKNLLVVVSGKLVLQKTSQ